MLFNREKGVVKMPDMPAGYRQIKGAAGLRWPRPD